VRYSFISAELLSVYLCSHIAIFTSITYYPLYYYAYILKSNKLRKPSNREISRARHEQNNVVKGVF
jgi:hypothetical protein